MSNNNTKGFDWDDLVTGEQQTRKGGFVYLKPGIYPFTVDSAEKSQSKTGKSRLKATLIIDGDDFGESKVFFQTTLVDQIINFFMSAGVLNVGEKKSISQMVTESYGKTGKVCIKDSDRKTDDGTPYSEVHYFIMPEGAEMEW